MCRSDRHGSRFSESQLQAMPWDLIYGMRAEVCVWGGQARQQVQEMVWMKQSENMVLEAMTRLSTVHDALEEMLRSDSRGGQHGIASQHPAHSMHSSSFGARRF